LLTLVAAFRHNLDVAVMSAFVLSVNGQHHRVDADPEMPLLWVLRDLLQLTGTKYGCGMGVCGACTVQEDGQAVRSCQVPISATANKNYTTIESLSANGDHPCQRAWLEEDVSQCGYCQAGMTMAAAALLHEKPNPSDADIDAVISELICRCGTYQRIRKAIHRAAQSGKT
jgi:isoquinoline 1-oxidoreductase subunit alpha